MSTASSKVKPAEYGGLDEAARLLGERFEFLGRLGLPGPDKYYSVLDRRGIHPCEVGEIRLVLKVPYLDAGAGGAALELFLAQTRAASVLQHKNITPVVDSDELNGVHYCLMAFPAEFETLRGILLRRGWLNIEDPVAYGTILQVSDALAHAHEKAVLHLLVRPEYILIDPSGDVFLTGFGLGRNDVSLVDELVRTSTPEYVGPELRDGHPPTGQTDLYSLGVTIYEMMTDRVPRHTGTPGGRKQSGAPLAPALLVDTVSAAVSELILRMLEPDPSHRFGSISDFRAALTTASEPVQAAVDPGGWAVDTVPVAINVTGDVTDTTLVSEQTIATLVQETVGDPQVKDPSASASRTLREYPNTIGGSGNAPVLPGPSLTDVALATGEESSNNPMLAGMRQHEDSLSKDNVVDLREQIFIRNTGGASAPRPETPVTFRLVDQSSRVGKALLLAAGIIVLVSAAVLIASQRWASGRKSESSLSIEQAEAPAAVNQTSTPNQSYSRQNDAVRPESQTSDQGNNESGRASSRASTHATRPAFRRPFKRHRRVQAGGYTGSKVRPNWRRSGYY